MAMKLMIVDDHAGARKMIRLLLDAPGVTFCECASGDEALQRTHEFQPDWITMDIHMPGLSGLKAAAEIKKQHPASRIVIVTGDDQPYFRGMTHLAGASAFVCKENLVELRNLVLPNATGPAEIEPSPEI
jgi:CheY-like chemotaxis protein